MNVVSSEEFVQRIRERMERISGAMNQLCRNPDRPPIHAREVFEYCSKKMNFFEIHLLEGPDTEARRNVLNNHLQEVEVLLRIDQ